MIRFYFVFACRRAVVETPPVLNNSGRSGRNLISAWRDRRELRRQKAEPAEEVFASSKYLHWYDITPLAEIVVSATSQPAVFPAIRRDGLQDFKVEEDVTRADEFVSGVVAKLQSIGVSKPRILEIGSGVYPIALRTCGKDAIVVVSDISLVMQTLASIMHTNNQAVLEGRAGFASFDMMYPPFSDGAFDIICICAAFHHIPSPHEFLKRLAPMLSPHGRFVAVREPCIVNPAEPAYISELSNGFNEQMFELAEWQDIISKGGLVIDNAVIDFGCSLKFSACLPSSDPPL